MLLIFAILCKIFVGRPLDTFNMYFLGSISVAISALGYGFTMAAIFVVTFFIIIQRFYKNLLGNEGYLMNTLPVLPWQNISSKLLLGMFWSIISCIVAVLSILVLSLGTVNYSEILPQLMSSVKEVVNYLGANAFFIPLEAIIALLLIMIYSSISLGHLFNKRKILASFASFIVLNIAMNIIIGIGVKIMAVISGPLDLSAISPILSIHYVLISTIAISLFFFAIYFGITNYVVKNKLNLE